MRGNLSPTIHDLGPVISRTASLIDGYLQNHFEPSVDGFFPSRLSGDEDEQTAKQCSALFRLVDLLRQLREIDVIGLSIELGEDFKQTWHSKQFSVLCCTGEESDEKIAGIYRDSIR